MRTTSTFELPTLDEITTIAAENNPNRIAFGEMNTKREITWGEFEEMSRQAAMAFRKKCSQGDRVGFLCDCSIDHITLWNGALKTGCVVSNLHTRAASETLAYCLDSIRPRVLVIDEVFSEIVANDLYEITKDLDVVVTTGAPRADYEESMASFVANRDSRKPDVRVDEDDVAAIQWTSGTTGRPKGWCHTHCGLGYKAIQLETYLNLNRTARQPHVFTPSFAAWYSLVLPALYANGTTYFLSDWTPEAFVELVERYKLTTAVLIPTMWREILQLETLSDYDLGSLDRIISSGESLDASTLSKLRENVCDTVYNSYAATEVLGTWISNNELKGEQVESVGKPISGTRIRIIEEGGLPNTVKDPGEIGEIIIKGPDCAVWAWGDTQKTEDTFQDGWWYSGDLGYKDENGYLYVEGRTDFMVKSKGIKVFPLPIEERLNDHPKIERVAVIGVPDEEYGEMVTAVVKLVDNNVTSDDLDEWCLESDDIARFERPRKYYFTEYPFPRTATGKLDRQTILDDIVDEN